MVLSAASLEANCVSSPGSQSLPESAWVSPVKASASASRISSVCTPPAANAFLSTAAQTVCQTPQNYPSKDISRSALP